MNGREIFCLGILVVTAAIYFHLGYVLIVLGLAVTAVGSHHIIKFWPKSTGL